MSVRIRRVTTTCAGAGVSAPPFDTFNLGDHVGDDPAAGAANRNRLAAALGLGDDAVVWMNQVHGDHVVVVDGPVEGVVDKTDALVTTTPRLALAVVTADLCSGFNATPVRAWSWRSTRAGSARKMVWSPGRWRRCCRAWLAQADNISALLGPRGQR